MTANKSLLQSTTGAGMHLHPYERTWIIISVALLVIFVLAITLAALAGGIAVPAPVARVNPQTVDKEGPFANPGLRELAPGKYEAYIMSQIWAFNPREITVPAGSTITFYVTSKDIQHGFHLEGTNVNMQVVPGQISRLTAKLDRPGEYTFICHEYCGLGHAAMFGKVIVTPK
jgi:cytochrome c oxidase subunit 2